jgi:microcystin-dependent protein
MSYEVRGFSGIATETALTGAITALDTTLAITVGTGTNYPSSDSFYVVVDLGLSTEEKILCSAQAANTLTVATGGRGADGTAATAHAVGASVKHVIAAVDLSEANRAVNKTVGQITAVGELLVGDALNSLNNLAPGANNTVLVADSTVTSVGLKYTTLGPSSLATDSVTTVKILDANVTTGKLADSSVTTLKLADDNVTTAKILDDNVTTAKILDGNVTTAKLAANAVTAAKITAATITATELASNAVTTAKILDANVTYAKLAADVAQLLTPAGIIVPYAGGTAPVNYLLCDGASVAVAAYPALHAAILYQYGGSGLNFNLPDLRGRVIAGKEATATLLTAGLSAITSTTLGATGGNEALHTHTHAPTVTATQATHGHTQAGHYHGFYDDVGGFAHTAATGTSRNIIDPSFGPTTSFDYTDTQTPAISAATPAITVSASNANAGAGGSQNVQPTIILNYIIKT